MTDPVAPLVAGYEVTGLLGAGSGGEVWLGRDRGTGEQVALKGKLRGKHRAKGTFEYSGPTEVGDQVLDCTSGKVGWRASR